MSDATVLLIGWAVVGAFSIAGTICVVGLAIILAGNTFWRTVQTTYGYAHVREAMQEWREKHPDKYAAFDRKFK